MLLFVQFFNNLHAKCSVNCWEKTVDRPKGKSTNRGGRGGDQGRHRSLADRKSGAEEPLLETSGVLSSGGAGGTGLVPNPLVVDGGRSQLRRTGGRAAVASGTGVGDQAMIGQGGYTLAPGV